MRALWLFAAATLVVGRDRDEAPVLTPREQILDTAPSLDAYATNATLDAPSYSRDADVLHRKVRHHAVDGDGGRRERQASGCEGVDGRAAALWRSRCGVCGWGGGAGGRRQERRGRQVDAIYAADAEGLAAQLPAGQIIVRL